MSTRNTAETLLKLFLDAIKAYGCPSRVRGDRGSENVDLCTWMIMYRGANRASFMWGTYVTHNIRFDMLAYVILRSSGPLTTPASNACGVRQVATFAEVGGPSSHAWKDATFLRGMIRITFGSCTRSFLKISKRIASASARIGTTIRSLGRGTTAVHWSADVLLSTCQIH